MLDQRAYGSIATPSKVLTNSSLATMWMGWIKGPSGVGSGWGHHVEGETVGNVYGQNDTGRYVIRHRDLYGVASG